MTRIRLGLACLLLLLGVSLPAAPPVAAGLERPRGAGLVVRHGDGRTLYVFVPFEDPEISGADLLQRSGLALVVAPYGTLGLAVCGLDNEGCPASDCFCQSRRTPSIYWHYQRLETTGRWVGNPIGPTSRVIHDGDVDGWAWGADNLSLPATTIDGIARLSGFESIAAPSPSAAGSVAPQGSAVAGPSPAGVGEIVPAGEAHPSPAAGPRGVEVAAGGRVTMIAPAAPERRQLPLGSLAAFGGLIALVVALGLVARRRRRAPP